MVSVKEAYRKYFWSVSSGIWTLLFLYISLVPYYYLQPVVLSPDLPGFHLPKYLPLCLIGCLALHSIVGMLSGWISVPNTVVDRYFIIYAAAAAASLAGAEFISIGAFKLVYFALTGFVLCHLLSGFSQKAEILHQLVRWMVGTAGLVALYGIVVYISGEDVLWGEFYRANNPYYSGPRRIASSIGNAVYAGSYFAICLPFAIWSADSASGSEKSVFVIICLLILVALLFTFSRGSWIASGVAVAVYLRPRLTKIIGWVGRCLSWRRIIAALTVCLLLSPILEESGFLNPREQILYDLKTRFEQSRELSESEVFRISQYGTTWNIIQDHPLLGVGFGNFTRLFTKYRHELTPKGFIATTTENMYLMILSETGGLGFAAFLWMMVAVIRKVYLTHRDSVAGVGRNLLLASTGSILGFSLNMMTWDALNQPTVRIVFWMFVGIALVQVEQSLVQRETTGENPVGRV